MKYQHTQRGYWGVYILTAGVIVVGLLFATVGWNEAVIVALVWPVVTAVSFCLFSTLTIEDEGDAIAARFGPVRLFSKRIRYSEITSVEPAHSDLIDGWGMHYVPGRGMIYNIWGTGCVRIHCRNRVVRFGSDEPEALAAFLKERIGDNRNHGDYEEFND